MSTVKGRYDVLRRLEMAGIQYNDAVNLRRIALTLHRWHEMECGTEHGCIERDEQTGKPYWLNSTTMRRSPIPDREKGAWKRLNQIIARYRRRFHVYVQGDPRGASLWLVRRKDVPKGASIDSYYSRGIAIY